MTAEEEIKKLEAEIETLRKELAENKKGDDERYKEIKQIQAEHHSDNLHWNKIGALATPITSTLIFPLVMAWFMKKGKKLSPPKQERNKEIERSLNDFNKSLEKKLNRILELLDKK